jgi:ORF6N domain
LPAICSKGLKISEETEISEPFFIGCLATLCTVETKVLVQTIKRSVKRFPVDFMFQLSFEEFTNLKSQTVTSSLKFFAVNAVGAITSTR